MTVRPLTPARAARRQLLVDRFAEIVSEAGAPYPEALAVRLRDIVENLGFTLPAAFDDPPPPPRHSTRAGRDAAKALLAEALASRHPTPDGTPPAH